MMQIIDSHTHLYPEPDLEREMNITFEPVNKLLLDFSSAINKNNIAKTVIYFLDVKILHQNLNFPDSIIPSVIISQQYDYHEIIPRAIEKNFRILKLLPYEHKITRDRYPDVLPIAEMMAENKMILTICSTYGSKLLYDTNGVELAAYIKKHTDIPIILAHGGGPRILDAMSIAMEYDDIFLDLSFSIKFWWQSSVIQDYAFAIKKLECLRCFYGSDYPYVSFEESIQFFNAFTQKYEFSEDEVRSLLYTNFDAFESLYLH